MKLSIRDTALLRRCASVLLSYPDDLADDELAAVTAALTDLPEAVAAPLAGVVDRLRGAVPGQLSAEYVETFDLRRRCCPYLTYYAYGDTRKRGMALLAIKQAFHAAGWQVGDEELPDHVVVLLEFAALEPAAGERLLAQHRPGLELLRAALHDVGSLYAAVLDAVLDTLGEPTARDLAAARVLAEQGPPAEEVGLEPFAAPEPVPAGRRR